MCDVIVPVATRQPDWFRNGRISPEARQPATLASASVQNRRSPEPSSIPVLSQEREEGVRQILPGPETSPLIGCLVDGLPRSSTVAACWLAAALFRRIHEAAGPDPELARLRLALLLVSAPVGMAASASAAGATHGQRLREARPVLISS